MLQPPNGYQIDAASLAHEFITTAQITQEQSGKKLVGKLHISEDSFRNITKFLAGDSRVRGFAAELPGMLTALETLLVKFEGMCQRRSIRQLETPFRERVYMKLCEGLYENTKFFECSPELLISPTLLSPIPLIEAFSSPPLSWFKENQPGTVQRAFISNPGNSVKFMHETHVRMQKIKTYLAQKAKKLPASTQLKMAMASHHTKPEELVEAHFVVTKEILQDPEFSEFYRNKKYAVDHALNNYGEKGARTFLRKVKGICQAILADESFASLRETPGTITIAAIHNPDHTAEFLEGLLAREARIKEFAKMLGREIGKKTLRDLCLKTPLRAKEFEMALFDEVARL